MTGLSLVAPCPLRVRSAARRSTTVRTIRVVAATSQQQPAALDRRGVLAASALTLLFGAPKAAQAGLNKKGNVDAYAQMMAEMKAGGQEVVGADEAYAEAGGACGPGYQMKVVKVVGASCECVDPSICKERNDLTMEERAFGKSFGKPAQRGDGDLPFIIAFE